MDAAHAYMFVPESVLDRSWKRQYLRQRKNFWAGLAGASVTLLGCTPLVHWPSCDDPGQRSGFCLV